MDLRRIIHILAVCAVSALATNAIFGTDIPDNFPRFTVPGHESETSAMRTMNWLHREQALPAATLWDAWIPSPSLWPATTDAQNRAERWRRTLEGRIIDKDGYVATHQHASIAHPLGWPFPFWVQGEGGAGWHFSFKDTVGGVWRPADANTTAGWTLDGARDAGMNEYGWRVEATAANAAVVTSERMIDTKQAPFIQIRWKMDAGGATAAAGAGEKPWIEWRTTDTESFNKTKRVYFDAPSTSALTHTAIEMHTHPAWKRRVAQLRLGFGNAAPGATAVIQALFTQYDTRHNVNNTAFVLGCDAYFRWTGDTEFVRGAMPRMRTALRHMMDVHHAAAEKIVHTTWAGHDGLTGIVRTREGGKRLLPGGGVGNNYWDLMPFGNKDCYATVTYYGALRTMAALERTALAHPEWGVAPPDDPAFRPDALDSHAEDVKHTGNALFWNKETGRFVACIDTNGEAHDYGYTFLNLEAIYYGFATPEHAASILAWISGERTVASDTSQTTDIYRWRFGPRASTKRNLDWYMWAWSNPEGIPWGGQVQDGGAVLGFSYHDLMARLAVLGPDDALARLRGVTTWFDEVQAAGGYREYYRRMEKDGVTLQGGGTAGGLGLDHEFIESVLLPQVMIDGFLGFAPTGDGFRILPRLPRDWPSLKIDCIRWHDAVLTVHATKDTIEVNRDGPAQKPAWVVLPDGEWSVALLGADGTSKPVKAERRTSDGALRVNWQGAAAARFSRVKPL
ncbi:hypothetical protein CVU37_07190 [candidate division BRC1 bacterium HGW-BRC1-1]|jgi:hypothetical protein|nr:MAG: hypothetical protein CVU37_07190 [candidate division BRC1 bacterium HGW-BRC1-1]